jgi:hypothetical protein
MFDFATWMVLLFMVAAAVLAFALYKRRWAQPRLRIKIHPKERVVLVAEGKRKPKNCPACMSPLEEGGPRARCELNAGHEIHEDCRQLVKGICPTCKGKLA